MEINISYDELSLIASELSDYDIDVERHDKMSIDIHTSKTVLFFTKNLNWNLKLIAVKDNKVRLQCNAGWLDRKSLKIATQNIRFIDWSGEYITIDAKYLIPYKIRFMYLDSIRCFTDVISISLKSDTKTSSIIDFVKPLLHKD